MRRLLSLILATSLLATTGAHSAPTLDSTTCAGGAITACPKTTVVGTAACTAGLTTTVTTAPFSTAGSGELICAFIVVGFNGSTLAAPTVSTTGGSFSTPFTKKADSGTTATNGNATVFCAVNSVTLSGVTLTASWAGNNTASVTIAAWSAASTTVGQVSSNHNDTSGTALLSYTNTTNLSNLYAVGGNFAANTIPTYTANASEMNHTDDGCGDIFWDEATTSTIAGGSVSFGTTAPTTAIYVMAGVEVCDSAVGAACGTVAGGSLVQRTTLGVGL